MEPASDVLEDELDWIPVTDDSVDDSFSSLCCCIESISISNRKEVEGESFRVTSNGSLIFDNLSHPVRRTNGVVNRDLGRILQDGGGDTDSDVTSSSLSPRRQPINKEDERFLILETIGKGSYGTVFKARDTVRGDIVAIKKMRVDMEHSRRKHFVNEMLALCKLKEVGVHPNIINYIDAYSCRKEIGSVAIIFEYMSGGSIAEIVHRNGAIMDETILVHICKECLLALEYIHNIKMIHRDIKPSNLLVSSKGCVKLSDFGLAKITNSNVNTTFVGTLKYMAPERAKGEEYGFSSDLFSLGLTILFTALWDNLGLPQQGYWNTLSERLEEDFLKRLLINCSFKVELHEIISRLLNTNAHVRADARSMLRDDIIRNYSEDGRDRLKVLVLKS